MKVLRFTLRLKNIGAFFLLITNSVIWFYLVAYITFIAKAPFFSIFRWVFYLSVLISTLIGPIITERLSRMLWFKIWIFLGVISSSIPMLFQKFGQYETVTTLVLLGFSFGIGFPSCFALIPVLTRIEERGRIGGIIFATTYALLFPLLLIVRHLGIHSSLFLLTILRSSAFGMFLFQQEIRESETKPISYHFILRQNTFFLYFFAWLAFCLVNYFEVQVLNQFYGKSITNIMITTEFTIGLIFCLLGGYLMDLKGRKWTIMLGLIGLGVGYALLSLFPLVKSVQIFYIVVDSIAFGIFTVAFIFVIWGDMSINVRGEKFYALGSVPFHLAVVLSLFLSPWIRAIEASESFSLAAFFIFLAIIPIFFAPELLPEQVLKRRELEEYARRVKRLVKGEA